MAKLTLGLLLSALAYVAQAATPSPTQSSTSTPPSPQVRLTIAQIAKKVSPAVVVIQGKTDSGEVQGSGFIISKDGKVVTNLHVIRNLKTASVQLANREMFDSFSVLAMDERRDLAIVQIGGFDLPVLELGNSDALTVGEPAVIVGSPRGLEGTVTAGILSSIRDSGEGFKVLQTDAAVNPGNSGGPLVNNKGQAIGVVSFQLRSAQGLNFAVPINYVRGLLNTLHGPMTLEQIRKDLNATTDMRPSPSLRQTLDWLKVTIPVSTPEYAVSYSNIGPSHTTVRTVPASFESCTVVFDQSGLTRQDNPPYLRVKYTTRYTIPLGALDQGRVFNFKQKDDLSYKGTAWFVSLHSKSQIILSETQEDFLNTTKTESVNDASLIFGDEALARRVQEAFNHAAELCRGKEPF
jgi:Trypsin-like peptidase domain